MAYNFIYLISSNIYSDTIIITIIIFIKTKCIKKKNASSFELTLSTKLHVHSSNHPKTYITYLSEKTCIVICMIYFTYIYLYITYT